MVVLLTIPEVCARLRVSRTHVERLVADGSLASVKMGRLRRIPEQALQQFIERHAATVGSAKA